MIASIAPTALRISQRLNKPEYWFQPSQLIRKLCFELGSRSARTTTQIRLPWGMEINVNPQEAIGRSLVTHGVYELAVSEALWRLTDPGDLCVDIGANIGYMTSLLSRASAPHGKVLSFEPHPQIFPRLQTNVTNWSEIGRTSSFAKIALGQHAVGAVDGELDLVEPDGFERNQGRASLMNAETLPAENRVSHRVQVRRLDGLLSKSESVAVLKIDVEGTEAEVLRGAAGLLGDKRIRDLVFEDERPFPSESATLLQNYGYKIWRLGKAIRGPVIEYAESPSAGHNLPWEPVNYLASRDARRAERRMQPRGWFCLSNKK
jgi:FkbM family methyltransferase